MYQIIYLTIFCTIVIYRFSNCCDCRVCIFIWWISTMYWFWLDLMNTCAVHTKWKVPTQDSELTLYCLQYEKIRLLYFSWHFLGFVKFISAQFFLCEWWRSTFGYFTWFQLLPLHHPQMHNKLFFNFRHISYFSEIYQQICQCIIVFVSNLLWHLEL